MDIQNKQVTPESSLTKEYEERVLRDFKIWYRQNQPTINETATQASIIANNAVGSLTLYRVISLLREHPEWTYQLLSVNEDTKEITISGIARIHLVKYLEQTIQNQGLKAVYANTQQER